MAIISCMTSSSQTTETMQQCTNAISNLFATDKTGKVSLDALRIMSKVTRTRKKIDPMVLNTLVNLEISSDIKESKGETSKPLKRKKQVVSRSVKKVSKAIREIEQELKEAEAVVDVEQRKKNARDSALTTAH